MVDRGLKGSVLIGGMTVGLDELFDARTDF